MPPIPTTPSEATQSDAAPAWYRPLSQVIPRSKYFAMAIFVMLPFVGGYVGYRLAPERVVEVPVFSDKNVSVIQPDYKNSNQPNQISPDNFPSPDSDLEVPVSEYISVQVNATSSSKYLVEEYTCTTKLNTAPHSCFRVFERSTHKTLYENLNDIAKEQGIIVGSSSRSELYDVRYVSKDGSRIYFTIGIPGTDACCDLAVFDTNTLNIAHTNMYNSISMSKFSPTNRYIASVQNDNKTITIGDLEAGKVIKSATVSTGNLIQTYCGWAMDNAADIEFDATSSSFVYGVYQDGTYSHSTDVACHNDKIGQETISVY